MSAEPDKRVQELKEAFQTVGSLRSREAWVLAAVWVLGNCTVQQICQATGQQQPEVSMAVRGLRQFIQVEQQRSGAGRPLNRHSIAAPQAVLEFLHSEERRRSAAAQRRLAALEAQAYGSGSRPTTVATVS